MTCEHHHLEGRTVYNYLAVKLHWLLQIGSGVSICHGGYGRVGILQRICILTCVNYSAIHVNMGGYIMEGLVVMKFHERR